MKNIAITVGVSLVVFLVAISFVRPVQEVVKEVTNLGSVVGPDSSFPCETHNGVQRCFNRQVMSTATTTVCSFLTPSATSTLVSAWARWAVSSSSASTVRIAKGANMNASTTLIVAGAIAAGAQGTLVASTTAAGAFTSVDGPLVVAPNTYINYSMQGGIGTFSPTGTCGATFEVAN